MNYHYLLTGVPSMGWYKIGGWNRNEHYRISLWPIGSWPSAIGGVQWIDLFFGEFITGNMKAGWWLTYPSEKSWSSSIGMIISHIFWKIKFMFQTTNQILWFSYGFPMIIRGFYENNGVFYHSLRCLRSSFRFGESGSAMFSRTKP